jgi:hypothetical protein
MPTNRYEILDAREPVYPFVAPIYPCGVYLITHQSGQVDQYSFRRMPRKHKVCGRFGLFFKDPDAGEILIALQKITDHGLEPAPNSQTVDGFRVEAFHDHLYHRTYTFIPRCSWCGQGERRRELVQSDYALIHPTCLPKAEKARQGS